MVHLAAASPADRPVCDFSFEWDGGELGRCRDAARPGTLASEEKALFSEVFSVFWGVWGVFRVFSGASRVFWESFGSVQGVFSTV